MSLTDEPTESGTGDLQAQLSSARHVIAALQDRITRLEKERDALQREVSFWEGHIVNLKRSHRPADDLCFTFTLSPLLFYSLSAERRARVLEDAVRNGWRALADSSLPLSPALHATTRAPLQHNATP